MKFRRITSLAAMILFMLVVVICAGGELSIRLSAAQSEARNPWPYGKRYDTYKVAPGTHPIRYEDNHIIFVEVAVLPGTMEPFHDHENPAVFARDAVTPKIKDTPLYPNSTMNGQDSGHAPAPAGMQFPTCQTAGPQGPHAVTNMDIFPAHLYRIEFKRVDGEGIKSNWKKWYPWMVDPLKPVKDIVPGPELGQAFSKEWPYSIKYDAAKADPNSHKVRYEDEHVRLLEVTIRPGEKENMHGYPYPVVIVRDAPTPKEQNAFLDPNSTMNGQNHGLGPAPQSGEFPTCETMGPQAPHAITNNDTFPAHFYRIEYKRIDGEDLKANWKTWYPWIIQAQAEFKNAQ